MRFGTILFCLVLLLSLSTFLFAQDYYAIESFDYPIGTLLDTLVGDATNGWAGPWDHFELEDSAMYVADSNIVHDDLNYLIPNTGLQATGGNIAAWGGQRYGRMLDKTWPDEAGNVYWISFLIELRNNFSNNGWAGLGLFRADTSFHELRLIGHEWGNGNYCLAQYTAGTYSDYSWDQGPQWLVVKLVMSGDSGGENAFMWVTPDPESGEPDTSEADVTGELDALNDGFNMIAMHFGNENVGARMSIDEIRLGTSWDDVSSDPNALPGKENILPYEFNLSQNYPNPFNPETNIAYSIQSKDNVRIIVYDIVGREIAVLVDGEQNAGQHTVGFSGAELTSGIYFYQLTVGNQSITKKMMLMK